MLARRPNCWMQVSIRSLSVPKKFLLPAVGWTGFILVMCLASMAALEKVDPLDFDGKDKILHFVFYFIFTALWAMYSRSRKGVLALKSLLAIFFLAVAYGSLIEILQATVTTTRSADFFDAVANTLGSAAAAVTFGIFYRKEMFK